MRAELMRDQVKHPDSALIHERRPPVSCGHQLVVGSGNSQQGSGPMRDLVDDDDLVVWQCLLQGVSGAQERGLVQETPDQLQAHG